jgi:mannose-6-phosphate isomerase
MTRTSNIFRLEGVVQQYSWGGKRFLPELLGQNNTAQKPFAEYWMGAHENAPSMVVLNNGQKQPLHDFIQENAKEILGADVYRRFARLPYLFKILDVHDMLSIQVHPTKQAAERDFGEENKNTSLNPAERNYKDDNHKPEIMLAQSDFWLLHGFKPKALLENTLRKIPELLFLLEDWRAGSYEAVYRKVMTMPQEAVNETLQPLIDRIVPLYNSHSLDKNSEDFWAARAFNTFCTDDFIDRGIFSIYLFNVVHLNPGEAIFQDAGILHAYLEGQNLELMANSDNVLRGGLTNKRIDVPELLKHVRFEPIEPLIIQGVKTAEGETAFPTPARDFELRRMELVAGSSGEIDTTTADIFLVMKGTATIAAGDTVIELQQAQSCLALANSSLAIRAGAQGVELYRATVPTP